jgi:nitronate monooxygenase
MTRFTDLVGCTFPLQQAAMGPISGPALAQAVSDAGALGMIGAAGVPTARLVEWLDALPPEAAVGANFLMPFLDLEAVEAAASRSRLVEFFYDEPDASLVARVHRGGALVGWQVGDPEEAGAAAEAGCDLITIQGNEAGGHIRGRHRLMEVLPAVRQAVSVPLVASGGIASGRQMAEALAAGADAVRVGTLFLAAREADVHPQYLEALIAAGPHDTVITETFALDWPAPHRVLRSSVDAAESLRDEFVAELVQGDERWPVPRLSSMPPTRAVRGSVRAMAMYAGESVAGVVRERSAAEIVRDLVEECEVALRQ